MFARQPLLTRQTVLHASQQSVDRRQAVFLGALIKKTFKTLSEARNESRCGSWAVCNTLQSPISKKFEAKKQGQAARAASRRSMRPRRCHVLRGDVAAELRFGIQEIKR
ncbi:hypothetical protein THIX_60084 [Thiomonas sp. X19]|nr:hypothetical protein THIX_60084 [Thiomonas sp. X19]